MRNILILTIFLVLAVMVMGCTQTDTAPDATTPSVTAQVTVKAPVATQAATVQVTAQAPSQGDAAKYQATYETIRSEVNQVVQYMGAASSKLNGLTSADQLPGALASVSNDLNGAKLHVQTAQGLAKDLTTYATTPQQQQDSQKILTDLGYLQNAITAMNTVIGEAQKPSPDTALMDAKIKESDDWLNKIV